jgi:DNA repair protein RadA/Sms
MKYSCSECGYTSTKWMGRCPACGQWNTFVEEVEDKHAKKVTGDVRSTVLSGIPMEKQFRFESGISEFDRVLGGGIVTASSVLIGGEPGIGKSTLMLQMAALCNARGRVVYVSGEESPSQVRQRAERLGLDLERINIFCETGIHSIEQLVRTEKPQVLIIDSLQTLETDELTSMAGSVGQMKNCCMELTSICKANGTAVFFIGHVTKEGAIAGPKVIEHVVDTVVYFEEGSSNVRIVRASKNRFGSVDEIGIFRMTEKGLEAVGDPSSFFVSQRTEETLPPGIAYTAVSEGSRTFLVEIQALVVRAKTGVSRVYSDRIDTSRVMRIAAILERHAGVTLSDKDIYVNVAGGVRVNDVSVELAIAMALWSAAYNRSLNGGTVCFGELSLAGEVRKVSLGDRRLKAAADMGFESAIVPASMEFAKTKMLITKCAKVSALFSQRPSA